MKRRPLNFLIACFAVVSMSACGSSSGVASAATQPTSAVESGGLGGTTDQPFAQRLAQTEYPKSLVQDPEAMKRILGEDKDNNGIRDDVDVFIATLGEDVVEIKGLQKYAKTIQRRLAVHNKDAAYVESDAMIRGRKCVTSIARERAFVKNLNQDALFDQSTKKMRILYEKTINTFERTLRSDEVDRLSHGHSFSFGPSDRNKQWCDQ